MFLILSEAKNVFQILIPSLVHFMNHIKVHHHLIFEQKLTITLLKILDIGKF